MRLASPRVLSAVVVAAVDITLGDGVTYRDFGRQIFDSAAKGSFRSSIDVRQASAHCHPTIGLFDKTKIKQAGILRSGKSKSRCIRLGGTMNNPEEVATSLALRLPQDCSSC